MARRERASANDLMAAIPVKNDLVREERRRENSLRLHAPLKPNLLTRLFASPGRATPTRAVEIDQHGLYVWERLDGKRSVDNVVTAFAKDHQMPLPAAQTAVLTFLHTLARRNLIAIIAPDFVVTATHHEARNP